MYEEPNVNKPCYKCVYKDYDSFHDLNLCGHKPLPDNLGGWTEIELEGTCEYWELDRYFYDE